MLAQNGNATNDTKTRKKLATIEVAVAKKKQWLADWRDAIAWHM